MCPSKDFNIIYLYFFFFFFFIFLEELSLFSLCGPSTSTSSLQANIYDLVQN